VTEPQDSNDGGTAGSGTAGHSHAAHGSLATEAALLLDAVAMRLAPLAAAASAEPAEPPKVCPECGHDGAASCTACPICRLLSVLKGERPEVTARLAEGALQVIGSLRTLLGEPPTEPAGGTGQATADESGEDRTSAAPRTHKVQHFDVD